MSELLQPERPRLSRADLFAILVLIAVGIGFFWCMVFTDLILPRGDVFTYFYPYWAYRNAALQVGRIPLWNPLLFMGVPFLANSQAGVLYPPNWLLIWLDAPNAIKVAIVSHAIWAAIGTYIFGRRVLHLSILSSTLAAITFALGGYFTAQAEHVNQLQGLAWMPWLFWLWDESLTRPRFTLWLALALAIQLLAGHTQTAFISGVGLGLWALWHVAALRRGNRLATQASGYVVRLRHIVTQALLPLSILAGASLLALGLASAQLLPTVELARLSNRNGGLPFRDAVSFSLRPELIGRALLPGFGDTRLFTEYVAYIGLVSLMLAIVGAWISGKSWKRLGLVLLAGVGLFFALGRYNPVYWLLIYVVPGFNLFRAPARWLVLFAFAGSVLAGVGLDALVGLLPTLHVTGTDPRTAPGRRGVWIAVAGIILVVALAPLALLSYDPLIGVVAPTLIEAAIWIGVSAAALFLMLWLLREGQLARSIVPPALASLAAIELFFASQALPYNHLSTPIAWNSQRPAISTLLAQTADQIASPRFLSLSDIRFDPGDLNEINAIFGPHLSADALYDYIIAVKQKEILAPNLPMAWGIPSMDGFDGGILPTRDYIQFTKLFLPEDAEAVDGRLREYLHAVPDSYWLDLADVDYVITDKVYDAWIEGIYYDLQFTQTRSADDPPIVMQSSQLFQATAIGVLGHLEGDVTNEATVGTITVGNNDKSIELPVVVGQDFSEPIGSFTVDAPDVIEYRTVKSWDEPLDVTQIKISVAPEFKGKFVLRGATLIDQRTGAFLPLSISSDVQTIHSGDVKIYAIAGRHPRAYVVCQPTLVDSDALMWDRMQSRHIPVVEDTASDESTCGEKNPGSASVTHYEPEHITIETHSDGDGAYLILSDAWYPGWQATIDGTPTEVLKANGMFRAVRLPAGAHTVEFSYESRTLMIGVGISVLSLLATLVGFFLARFPRSASQM